MGTKVSPYTGKRYGCVNSTLAKPYSCDHCLGSPTREIGAFSPGRKRLVACVAQYQRHASMIEDTQEAMFAEDLFAEELAAKAAAAGAEMSPWACTLDKSYSCDQYLGPPTREFGALSPSSNRLVAWAV